MLQDEVNSSVEAKEIMKIVNEFLVITDAAADAWRLRNPEGEEMKTELIKRRSFLLGLSSLIAAPAIVRAASIMPVKALKVFDIQAKCPDLHWAVGRAATVCDPMIFKTPEGFYEMCWSGSIDSAECFK